MYYVYKVKFDNHNAVYVGCTNDIRRRKDQHNENARKRKGFFGRFLNSCGIVLTESDFSVIAEFEDRHTALVREKQETVSLIGTGVLILNDNYSDHCSRKGLTGKSNPSSKTYVVIDTIEHNYEVVDDMHCWCNMHEGISYKTMIGTARRKPKMHKGRYIAREASEWDSLSDSEKDDLVSGRWYAKSIDANLRNHIERMSKTYLLMTPDGSVVEVRNLDKFARDNGINCGNLHASLRNGRSAQGYKVLERLS